MKISGRDVGVCCIPPATSPMLPSTYLPVLYTSNAPPSNIPHEVLRLSSWELFAVDQLVTLSSVSVGVGRGLGPATIYHAEALRSGGL